MHYYFLVAGLLILIIGNIFRRKNKVKNTYLKFNEFVSNNAHSWEDISNDIIQRQDVSSLNDILDTKVSTYLIAKGGSGVKIQSLNNEKTRNMSLSQYEGILKKLETQDLCYTFNIDTGSIYYRFASPYEDCILWIYME